MSTPCISNELSVLVTGSGMRALIEQMCGTRLQTLLSKESFLAIPQAIGVFVMIVLHVCMLGWIIRKRLRLRFRTVSGSVGVTLALGFAGFGVLLWLLGSLHGLHRWFFFTSSLACLTFILSHSALRTDAKRVLNSALAAIRRHRIYAGMCGLLISSAFFSGLRPPVVYLDDDYHWQTATLWAQSGYWATSPYRLTNGPALAEMYFTVGALFDSPIAAHWTATFATVVLALSAAGIAARVGIPALPSAAAVLSIPVLGNHASLLLNDAMATMFTVSAFAAFWCSINSAANPGQSRLPYLASGLLLAGALSCKFLSLAAAPAVCILVILQGRRHGSTSARILKRLLWCFAPVLVTGLLWTAHTYSHIGKLRDDSGQYMARSSEDAYWKTGAAAGRIPNLDDIFRLPIDLIQTTVWGQKEPYGGRTGALWLAFLPIGLLLIKRNSTRDLRIIGLELLLSGLSIFFLLGPIALKTRFHLPVFVFSTLFSAIAWWQWRRRAGWLQIADTLFFLCIAIGMLDGIRKQMMGIFLEVPPG